MADPFDLTGRVALVTGGAGGLGTAMGRALHAAGASLVLADLDLDRLDRAAAAIARDRLRVGTAVLDVTDEAAVQAAVAGVTDRHGRLDILLNNAGIGVGSPFPDEDMAQWRRVLRVNLDAVYLVARAAARPMVAQGWGRIVNIASIYGAIGSPHVQAYAASKHAVVGLTRSIAAELGPLGVTCNAIGPGFVQTAMTAPLQGDAGFEARLHAAVPLRRWAVPEDLAGPALFLCSPGAGYVNGHFLLVDGGMTGSFL
ncbi:MAG: SDR family oxidoreductase [Sneathiellaceae bacterium]